MTADYDFGMWLRQRRSECDLTQEALAEAVGCASQTVRSFESGRRRPSREMAARLADVLKVPSAERDDFLRLARSSPRTVRTLVDAPAVAVPTRQNNSPLPLPADGLIGRHHDQERLRRALLDDQQRLVTLLGPGGVGKTRLALQTVTNLAAHFADTAFVALAPVSNLAGVVTASAVAVGCPLSGIPDQQAALVTFLRERRLLLVLDNIEHLLTSEQVFEVVDLLTTILRAAPGVAMLVTSRERLRLQTEWVVEIGGLSLPTDDQPASIAHSDAVLLFVERARRVTGDFALGPHNQLTVAQICRRLDGLPLAIELAAAQVSFLPPPALLARLDQALPLLEGGARDLPARQQTMRATIGWSHNLLSTDERRVFERLGVLMGSFSLAAAEAVGAGSGIVPAHVLGLLRRLVDRSLVMRDHTTDDDVRYRLLEPVRQYAGEQLDTQELEATQARQRHVAYFVARAAQLGPQLRVPQDTAAFIRVLAQIEQEYPNIRTAIAYALASGQAEAVAQIGWSLCIFWWYRNQPREPRAWMEAVLAQPERLAPHVRARALLALVAALYGGPPSQSLSVGQEALALFEQCDDTHGQAQALLFIGLAHLQSGTLEQAADTFERAYNLSQSVGDPWLATATTNTLGLVFVYAGEYARATACLNAALAMARTQHDIWNALLALFNSILLAHAQNNVLLAARLCREWLASAPDVVIVNGLAITYILESLVVAADLRGEQVRAARLYGAAEGLRDMGGTFFLTPDVPEYTQRITALRSRIATPVLAAAYTEGRAMHVTQAVAYALEMSSAEHAV